MKKKITLLVAAVLMAFSVSLACNGGYYACSASAIAAYAADLQANCPVGSTIVLFSCTNEPTVIVTLTVVEQ